MLGRPRLVRLGELAFRAEWLRRRRQVRGHALRAALGAAAAVFALLTPLGLYLAAWAALARPLGPIWAAGAVVLLDLALCLGLGWVAARRAEDRVAREARSVRDDALRHQRTLGTVRNPRKEGRLALWEPAG